MAGIDLIDLNKYYGAVHAVKDVSLSFGPEEFVVLVGPSGCGKTTVLRMVAGLETISSGELLIASQRANELSPAQRDIAMVFQNYALYPNMSVYENMAFGLRNRGASRDKVDSEIRRAADVLGIEKLLTRKPRQLSGGQQQRVALGRCLVRHPKVFLFDEPLSNLDAKLRLEMRQELKRLRSRISATSIYVTHDQVEAMTLGDRVVVMANGQVQQAGTPAEIYHRPQNVFVATFIGSPPMNLLPVQISNEHGSPVFEAKSLKVPVPADLAALLSRHGSSSVLLGLRPEDVTVQPAPGPHSHATGVVELSELLGSEQLLETRVGDASVTVTRIDPFAKFTSGDVVGLQFALANLHVFDPATGMNLAADRKTASGTDVTSIKQPPRRSKAFSN